MSTVLGQINKNAGACPLTRVMSFGEGEDARVGKPNVRDLPPTQPEVATERHMRKPLYSKQEEEAAHDRPRTG